MGGSKNSGSDRMFVARQFHYVKGQPTEHQLCPLGRSAARCCSKGIPVGVQKEDHIEPAQNFQEGSTSAIEEIVLKNKKIQAYKG